MKKVISFILAVTMLMGTLPVLSIAAEESLNEGLILYYNFDTESEHPTKITDSSGNGNHGEVLNTYTSELSKELSVVNGIACFPGFGYMDETIVKGAAIRLPEGINEGVETFTYSSWIKASWASESDMRVFDFGNIGSNGNNPYNSIFTKLTVEDLSQGTSTIRFHDRKLSSSAEDRAGFVETKLTGFNNTWSLYTLVYEKNEETGFYETTVYVDGKKIDALCDNDKFTRSLDDLGVLNKTSNGMYIGRSVWTAVNQYVHQNPDFKGQMDEIRLYNRALSQDEVKYLYNNTKPIYYDFITGYEVPVINAYVGEEITLPEKITYNTAFSDTELKKVTWLRTGEGVTDSAGVFKIDGNTDYGEVLVIINVLKSNSGGKDGLLLYYNFDSDSKKPSKIIDASGNGNDAKVLNNGDRVITITEGVAKFPGMESSSLGAALKLPNTINQNVKSFTYSAWVKADSSYKYADKLTRFFDFGNIGSGSNNPRNSIFARYTSTSGLLYVQDRYLNKSKDATLSAKPFTDKWGHFTFVYEEKSTGYYELTIYVNGKEVEEMNSSTLFTRGLSDLGTLDDKSNGMLIGRTVWAQTGNYATDNPDFCGEMDEIRLYNRALTEEEIQKLYKKHKPSGEDFELSEYKIPIKEDVEVTYESPAESLNGSILIKISSGDFDTSTHFGLMRTGELDDAQKMMVENSEEIILRMYMMMPESIKAGQYFCYGLTGENNMWDVDKIVYGNYVEHINGSVLEDGTTDAGELLDIFNWEGGVESFFIEFDVTDFVKENTNDFSFLISTDYEGGSVVASELSQGYVPELVLKTPGMPVEITRMDTDGNVISSSIVFENNGKSYTYTEENPLITYNGAIYAVDEEKSKLTIDKIGNENEITVVYKAVENVSVSTSEVRTYVGAKAALPDSVTVQYGKYTSSFEVEWENSDKKYAEKGVYTAEGVIAGTNVGAKATVTVFPEYNGQAGGDLVVKVFADGELREEKTIEKAYGATFVLDTTYENYLGNNYRLDKVTGDVTAIGKSLVMNKLNQKINLYFVMTEELTGALSVKIKADSFSEETYTLTISATALNTKLLDETVSLVIADYEKDALEKVERIQETAKSRTGEYAKIEKQMQYVKERDKDKVIYLWGEDMVPIAKKVRLSDVKIEKYLSEEVLDMMPTYTSAVTTLNKANNYWQSQYAYNKTTNGLNVAFWARAAYHTGNIEAYKLTKEESYLDYSVNWANYCNWEGNNYTGDPSNWTWSYNQNQGSTAVLFGDWQTCFQSFIDLYELGVEDAKLDKVLKVMDYQASLEDEDAFWWWADGLYMVMPVMSKLYKLTGDEKYLDSLYKWFKYAKELMYDGPGGIPSSKEGYTTSASLKNGAYYSDPDNYANLFYRDANYVYPLRPNTGHINEKNFWARGNGWVFAGLAKVLADMPSTYEHYDEFYNTYMEMAPAIIACQQTDDSGYGFWTQSMLQNYPIGNNGNDEGYETSGTAFMTYGLFWGINNGLLDEEIYLEPTIRAWGYLEKVALHSNGKVGYVQPIGSNATQATDYNTTQDFGVGAYLLACCEAARYAQNN